MKSRSEDNSYQATSLQLHHAKGTDLIIYRLEL